MPSHEQLSRASSRYSPAVDSSPPGPQSTHPLGAAAWMRCSHRGARSGGYGDDSGRRPVADASMLLLWLIPLVSLLQMETAASRAHTPTSYLPCPTSTRCDGQAHGAEGERHVRSLLMVLQEAPRYSRSSGGHGTGMLAVHTVQKIAMFEKNGGMQALIQYPGTLGDWSHIIKEDLDVYFHWAQQ